ncbi:MAG TPA: hypothetical protein VGO13_10080 [Solirubrobacterales bacterium]|jgi:hypothetical protein|nr:hypothetical protein [Solirubrobacterales bacterium]
MAVAAPKRRTAPAPAPSRTSPPPRKAAAAPARAPQKKAAPARRPRTRPTPKGRAATAPAPARKAPARKAPSRKSPARKTAGRKASATRTAPARAPRRARTTSRAAAVGGQLIPFAGRTAVAVGQLPDSGLMVRMTRGRAWIAVLGVLLVGIVTLNVITLSFAASSGKIDEQITALGQENSILGARDAKRTGIGAVRSSAGELGLAMPSSETIHFATAGPDDIATAAQRLAAAAP